LPGAPRRSEDLVHLLLEALGDGAGPVGELVLDLPGHRLELGPHEFGVCPGLLAIEHARADLDRVLHQSRGVSPGLGALPDQACGRLVVHDETVDAHAIADRGRVRV
jgi:hypothetical protein